MIDVHDIVKTIPGWEEASANPLGGGSSRRSWLLELDGRKAVLKADPGVRSGVFGTRQYEAEVQHRAAAAGLAPQVLYATDTVLLSAYVDSTVWTEATFADADRLRRLGRAIKRVHELPSTGRPINLIGAAHSYLDVIEEPSDALIAGCRIIESIGEPRDTVCGHNDVVFGNILGTTSIQLVDWEFAADNSPLFDLATVIEHHSLDEELAAILLEAYFVGRDIPWQALVDQRIVYRELFALWQAATSRS